MSNETKPTITISEELCHGHNRCCRVAPELFESDELGNALVKGDGTVSEELMAKARLAIANCPEGAIRLINFND
jgi:ferredoxin